MANDRRSALSALASFADALGTALKQDMLQTLDTVGAPDEAVQAAMLLKTSNISELQQAATLVQAYTLQRLTLSTSEAYKKQKEEELRKQALFEPFGN